MNGPYLLAIAVICGIASASTTATGTPPASSQWQLKGTWTVPGGVAQPPANLSVTPSSGAGNAQTFAFRVSSSGGYQNLAYVQMIFSNTATSPAYCMINYVVGSNTAQVNNDNGSGWAASGALGSAGTLENSQCRVTLGASSASGTGTTLTNQPGDHL